MITAEQLYTMKLHESLFEDQTGIMITRVAGGWLYAYRHLETVAFVPFNSEFQASDGTSCYHLGWGHVVTL